MFNYSLKKYFEINYINSKKPKIEFGQSTKKINLVSHTLSFSKVQPCALCAIMYANHKMNLLFFAI